MIIPRERKSYADNLKNLKKNAFSFIFCIITPKKIAIEKKILYNREENYYISQV